MGRLVLVRREGEEVILTLEDGRRIVVYVAYAERGKARLAFDAPETVVVNRREVQEGIDREGGR